jgi:hypothetical protein
VFHKGSSIQYAYSDELKSPALTIRLKADFDAVSTGSSLRRNSRATTILENLPT